MAQKSTAADDSMSFCIAVQTCTAPKCNKNGTHHLCINYIHSSDTGKDCSGITEQWYCDKHYKLLRLEQ